MTTHSGTAENTVAHQRLVTQQLLTGAAEGHGGLGMLLELLTVLRGKDLLSDAEVQRVVNVLVADMRHFNAQVQGRAAVEG